MMQIRTDRDPPAETAGRSLRPLRPQVLLQHLMETQVPAGRPPARLPSRAWTPRATAACGSLDSVCPHVHTGNTSAIFQVTFATGATCM